VPFADGHFIVFFATGITGKLSEFMLSGKWSPVVVGKRPAEIVVRYFLLGTHILSQRGLTM